MQARGIALVLLVILALAAGQYTTSNAVNNQLSELEKVDFAQLEEQTGLNFSITDTDHSTGLTSSSGSLTLTVDDGALAFVSLVEYELQHLLTQRVGINAIVRELALEGEESIDLIETVFKENPLTFDGSFSLEGAIDGELSIPQVEYSEDTAAISIDGSTVFLESDPMGAPGEFINSEYEFVVPKLFLRSDEQEYEINQFSWLIETTEGKTAETGSSTQRMSINSQVLTQSGVAMASFGTLTVESETLFGDLAISGTSTLTVESALTAFGPMTDFKLAMSVQDINRAIADELQTFVQRLGMTTDEDEQAVMTQEFLSKTADLFVANSPRINIDEFKFNFGTDEFINLKAELKLNKDKIDPSSIALIQQLGLAGASILIPALEFRMDADLSQQALMMAGAMNPALAATLSESMVVEAIDGSVTLNGVPIM